MRLRSKCCGAKVKWGPDMINTYAQAGFHGNVWVCQRCKKPTEARIKDDE